MALRGRRAFLDRPAVELEARMRELVPGVEVHTLRPGQELVLEKPRAGARRASENSSADGDRE